MKIKRYLPFYRGMVMNTFIYRGSIWLWFLMDLFQFVMMIFLWQSVFRYNETINGFGLNDMLIYFLLINVFFIFTELDTVFVMAEEIREGRVSLYLIKPISYYKRLMAETLGHIVSLLILMLPIAIGTGIALTFIFDIRWNINPWHVLIALAYLPLIFLLLFEYNYFFGTLSIHTTNVFGLAIFMSVFIRATSGQLIPLAFYPESLLKILNYFPFRFISYPPLLILNQMDSRTGLQGLIILSLWVLLFRGISFMTYKLSIKKMVVFGG
jgi:ABC-2 type transport system permease protein